ncbi:hypothetical protein DBR47_22005 [Paucibacter sp. KBW04]|uniref:copper chaperone PCu(A)C n=1 Tax=Paucibacter sp. KBW04 TaxID=2153361 RepID=UPI000F57A29A|nr:copper chaperone PCu(A)C [Paucibacter sp. KBW04]RQO54745.1 hypothetical protein DBR47_22005 [Paucibacter sp. KBW04]
MEMKKALQEQRRLLLQGSLGFGLGLMGWWPTTARACEFYTTHLRITHPWTRVSAPGQTTAIISLKFDEVTKSDRLIGVSTPVAQGAVLGGPGASESQALNYLVPAGRETLFSEQGLHIRLTGLRHPLEMARSYPLSLLFEQGGRVEADLSVDYEALTG